MFPIIWVTAIQAPSRTAHVSRFVQNTFARLSPPSALGAPGVHSHFLSRAMLTWISCFTWLSPTRLWPPWGQDSWFIYLNSQKSAQHLVGLHGMFAEYLKGWLAHRTDLDGTGRDVGGHPLPSVYRWGAWILEWFRSWPQSTQFWELLTLK